MPGCSSPYLGGPPWERPADYLAASPLFRIARARTPTLILHGENDPVVPVGHARQLYAALTRNGVPAELWTYPGEGHGLYRRDHLTDARRRVIAWFRRWLDGDGG